MRRVVFIATPHAGSIWARRPIGRLSASLAKPDPVRAARYAALLRDNPGVFSSQVSSGIPTSIDMLNPDSKILQAMRSLPASSEISFHSIYGKGFFNFSEGRGDGVVSLRSANSPLASTHYTVHAFHTKVHRKLDSVNEVWRILTMHLEGASTQKIHRPQSVSDHLPVSLEYHQSKRRPFALEKVQ